MSVSSRKSEVLSGKRKGSPIDEGDLQGRKVHKPEPGSWIPQELILHIFSFLDFKSLISSSLVCRLWNCLLEDNQFWQSRVVEKIVAV